MSLCGGVGCGVVGLRNGDCAGRHGGAPASKYVGGIAHTRRRSCLKFLFSFHLACKVPSCLLVLTSPRHGKGDGDGNRRSIFSNVCASISMCCWVKEQLDQGTAGESEKQHGHGWVGVDGFVELFCAACVSGAAWLGWLACLPAGVGLIYESLWWCGMWCAWVAKRGLCWATRRCPCQKVREGHRTHQTTILLEVSFSFPFSLQGSLLFVGFDSTEACQGRW